MAGKILKVLKVFTSGILDKQRRTALASLDQEAQRYGHRFGPGCPAAWKQMLCEARRGTTRAKDALGTPAQSYISPSIPVYEDATFPELYITKYTSI